MLLQSDAHHMLLLLLLQSNGCCNEMAAAHAGSLMTLAAQSRWSGAERPNLLSCPP